MRRLSFLLLAACALCGSAAAATIHGTPRPDRVHGSAGPDRIDVAFGGDDTVSCGAGRDLVVADRGDLVSPDCEVVVRRISADPSRAPKAQHETAVEPDSASWGSTAVAAFQVGRLASGGAAQIGFATSTDAGRTWAGGTLPGLTSSSTPPGPQSAASDPAVAYDAVHGVWLVASLGITARTSVLVSRSADGVHWQAPVDLADGPLLDKEWIACDDGAASPFRGRCYVLYTDDALHQLTLQESTDGGATWSAPARVTTDLLGAEPVVRPDGSVVVLAVDLPQGDQAALVSLVSPDGGATFSSATVANFRWHQPAGMRAVPLPSAAVDADGDVYAAWQQCPGDQSCSANEIVLASSQDGSVWDAAVPLTAAATDHFVVGLGADPSRPGRLALVYDLFQPGSCAAGACRLGVAFASTSDGGDTWTPGLRLDVTPFAETWLPEAGGRMVGDYFSTSFAAGRAVPVFALAEQPLAAGRFREGIFAASIPVR